MDMVTLEQELDQMVRALKLRIKKTVLGRDSEIQYTVDDFCVFFCGIERMDYRSIDENLQNRFEGWRIVYVTTEDVMLVKKDEVIWELMRSGYMKWIRLNFPRDFGYLMSMQNFGNKIIDHRLKIWADQPKYKFIIEDNMSARELPANYVLSTEPAFFDYMP